MEREVLLDILELETGGKNFNGESTAFGTVSSRGWVHENGNVQNSAGGLGGARGDSNIGVLRRQPKGNSARAFISVVENLTSGGRGRINNSEEAVDARNASAASSSYPRNIETAVVSAYIEKNVTADKRCTSPSFGRPKRFC